MLIIIAWLYHLPNCKYNKRMNEQSVTEHIKKAFESKASGNYKQAIEYFYRALTIDSESSEIMSEIANLYFKINNPERAIEYYEQALESDPFNLTIKFNLALVYKHVGNVQKAIDLIESVYIKSRQIDYLIELLHSLYLEGRYEEVIDMFNKSDFVQAESDSLFYYVGLSYMSLGKNDDAQSYFKTVLKYNPLNLDAKYFLAEILFDKKSYEEAESLLLGILENKICAKSYYLLGQINFSANRLEKAINYFSIASNIEFKNPLYFYELGTVYSLKGFFKEAEENYQKAIKLSPNNLHYNYTLAYLYHQMGEVAKAKQKISYVLSINPHHLDALVLQALISAEEDDVLTANKILDEVLKDVSNNDFAFYVKSLLYKKLNWWEKAIETILKAIEIKPESLEYLSELATYYYHAKFYGDTKTVCYKILAKDSKYLYAYIMLAKCYLKNKDYEQALKNLETAINLDSNSDEAYYTKAQVYRQTNVNVSAIETAKKAISIAPNKVEYYDFVANCYYELENYKEAYFYYKEAADIDMLSVTFKYYMAKCAQFNSDIANAVANFSVAKRLEPSNVFISIEYADFLCSINKHKKALDILKSTLEYNPVTNDKEDLLNKIDIVQKQLAEKSGILNKMLSKLKAKR